MQWDGWFTQILDLKELEIINHLLIQSRMERPCKKQNKVKNRLWKRRNLTLHKTLSNPQYECNYYVSQIDTNKKNLKSREITYNWAWDGVTLWLHYWNSFSLEKLIFTILLYASSKIKAIYNDNIRTRKQKETKLRWNT